MIKKSKLITVLCSVTLGVIIMLGISLATLLPKLMEKVGREIVFSSASATATYNGETLTKNEWKIKSGELKDGHEAIVTVTGAQRNAGTSENHIKVKIVDKYGADVSDEYNIKYAPGTLTVNPVMMTVISNTAFKVYDGEPLTDDGYTVFPEGAVPEGHELEATITGTITEIGTTDNTIEEVRVFNEAGKDVTFNFAIIASEGVLSVTEFGVNGVGGIPPEMLLPGMLGVAGLIGSNALGDTGAGADSEQLCYILRSDTAGRVYLKLKNFGAYGGKSWADASPYNSLIDSKYSAYYLTSEALRASGVGYVTLEIDSKNGQYVFPYSALTDGAEYVQQYDTQAIGKANAPYTVLYYPMASYKGLTVPAELAEYEASYRKFVHTHYLKLDDTTRAYMQGIIQAQGFSTSDPDIVNKVARFIQGSARYNLEYDQALDSSENIAIAFLETYKEGICQHYATSATLLFRALGIPARYTVGFVSDTVAGAAVEVTADQAHAWVEVYIDGLGWIVVEVTGSDGTGGGMNSGSGSGGTGMGDSGGSGALNKDTDGDGVPDLNIDTDGDGKADLNIDTNGDGKADLNINTDSDLKPELNIDTDSDGKADLNVDTDGDGAADLNIDTNGDGIPDKNIDTDGDGVPDTNTDGGEKPVIEVVPVSYKKLYDGTPITTDNVLELTKTLKPYIEAGYSYSVTTYCDRVEPGKGKVRVSDGTFRLFDPMGADVTEQFTVEYGEGVGQIYIETLLFTSENASRVYDGKLFVGSEEQFSLSSGGLLPGHSIRYTVKTVGIVNAGSASNSFIAKIVDADENDVSDIYNITYKFGKLEIVPLAITVTAGSKTAKYTGDALTCNDISITLGALAEGDRIGDYRVVGSQTERGRSDNVVKSVEIVNADGVDVTSNYAIKLEKGVLKVTGQ